MYKEKNTYQNMFMNRLCKTDLMEAHSYLLKTVYSLWHDHSLLHYSYKQTDIPVYTSGTDTWSHSLFPQTHCHMLLINMIIKVKKIDIQLDTFLYNYWKKKYHVVQNYWRYLNMKPTYVYIYSVQDPICIPDSNIFHPFYKIIHTSG